MDIAAQRLMAEDDGTLAPHIDACVIVVANMLIGNSITNKGERKIESGTSPGSQRSEVFVELQRCSTGCVTGGDRRHELEAIFFCRAQACIGGDGEVLKRRLIDDGGLEPNLCKLLCDVLGRPIDSSGPNSATFHGVGRQFAYGLADACVGRIGRRRSCTRICPKGYERLEVKNAPEKSFSVAVNVGCLWLTVTHASSFLRQCLKDCGVK